MHPLNEFMVKNLTIAQAKNSRILNKWEGKTPAKFTALGMYVCTRCRHTCSVDDTHCHHCGTEKFIISTPGKVRTPATKILAELIYKN